MDPKANLWREIMRVEAEIDSPASRGKRTILKSYHRKLCREYTKARKETGYPRTSDSTWHPGDEM